MASGLALATGSSGSAASDEEQSRSDAGAELLAQARRHLSNSEDHVNAGGAAYAEPIRKASERHKTFVLAAFAGYRYLEACDTGGLLYRVLEVDAGVNRGYFQERGDRVETLAEALQGARDLAEFVEGCSPGFAPRADEVLRDVRKLKREREDGRVGDRPGQTKYVKLLSEIRDDNRNLVASSPDQVNGGCEVPGFYRNLATYIGWATSGVMTTPQFLLGFNPPKSAKHERDADAVAKVVRRESVEGAYDATTRMIRAWKACSPPECEDGVDNDDDGMSDAGDVGCKSGPAGDYDPEDESENKAEMSTVVCGGPGTSGIATHHMTNGNAGDDVIGLALHNVSTGAPIFVKGPFDSDLDGGGPAPLGDSVCGPGTVTSVTWRVDGTSVIWDFTIVKEDKEAAPPRHRIVAVANTR